MKKLQKIIGFTVLVLILAGISTAFVTVHGVTTFFGTVENPSEDPVSGVGVVLYDSYYNILGSDSTDSNGDYSFTATLSGHSPYNLYVIRERFDTEIKPVTAGGRNDFELEGDGYKLAYLFYANDASDEESMERYEDILDDEGYTVEIIADCSDVEGKCEDIADYEIYSDTIFVYVMGHGEYSGGHSYTLFDNQHSQNIGSQEFKGYLDDWEADKVFLFVDSCDAGGWADDFAETPYLVISSSDETHDSYRYDTGDGWEGRFSHAFFYHIDDGQTAVAAFNLAEVDFDEPGDSWPSYPEKEDYSSYTWFN